MNLFRKILIISHRYGGVLLCFVFVLWFASAFTIMYTGGMPRVTADDRLSHQSPLDLSKVTFEPGAAVSQNAIVTSIVLETLLDRPVYRVNDIYGRQIAVYADNGDTMTALDSDMSSEVAARFLGVNTSTLEYTGMLTEPDQWTLTVAGDLPVHRFLVQDTGSTEIYVSAATGKVSVYTTARTRMLAWIGAIPHWFYVSSIRNNHSLWYRLVVYSAGIGCAMTVIGLVLAMVQLRKSRPFTLRRAIPYHGILRWHYILGVLFGVPVLTWTFSGMLSMEPFQWTRAKGMEVPASTFTGGDYNPDLFKSPVARIVGVLPVGDTLKSIDFLQVLGIPFYLVTTQQHDSGKISKVLMYAADLTIIHGFNPRMLVEVLAGQTGAGIVDYTVLDSGDHYYYSRVPEPSSPVLRVKLDDPGQSWVYIDVFNAAILASISKQERLKRWLYHGLHSLDFSFIYNRRPLWDITVILLLSAGLAVSLVGLYLGMRRVFTDFRRLSGSKR